MSPVLNFDGSLIGDSLVDVTCLSGDGVGERIMRAAKRVAEAAVGNGVLKWIDVDFGAACHDRTGRALPPATIKSVLDTYWAIKGPGLTPQGEGHASPNVALRRATNAFAGIRVVQSLGVPGLPFSKHLVVVRHNIDDFYTADEEELEFEDENPVVIRVSGRFDARSYQKVCEKAFEYASLHGLKRVTHIDKANILKKVGAMYRRVFKRVASLWPGIDTKFLLVDATAAKAVRTALTGEGLSDVLIGSNLMMDIISDATSEIVGGLGLSAGANIGEDCYIAEAVHGTADDIAGEDIVNPTALILSMAGMLGEMGALFAQEAIVNGLKHMISNGFVTKDLANYYKSPLVLSTTQFVDALVDEILLLQRKVA